MSSAPLPALELVLLDVNGTLTDPSEIGRVLERPELGDAVLDRAVHTAMVDALLGSPEHAFSEHLRSAVETIVAEHALDGSAISPALEAASGLPARPDAAAALKTLRGAGLRLVALTNSGADSGRATLEGGGLLGHVERVLGVDAVQSFKPHPAVYTYALTELGLRADQVLLLATHPWDLAGAAHAGMATAWVRHGPRAWPSVFPPPVVEADSLHELAERLTELSGA